MKEIIPNGTNVLIFNKVDSQGINDETKFIKGVIIDSRESQDLAYHGSSWYEQIYKVQGEDGKIYTGTYGSAFVGDFYIRTLSDYLKRIRFLIEDNHKKINDLNTKNAILNNILLSLIPDKKEENNKDSVQSHNGYYAGDSDDIAERLKGFKYRPEDKEKILEYYKKDN